MLCVGPFSTISASLRSVVRGEMRGFLAALGMTNKDCNSNSNDEMRGLSTAPCEELHGFGRDDGFFGGDDGGLRVAALRG